MNVTLDIIELYPQIIQNPKMDQRKVFGGIINEVSASLEHLATDIQKEEDLASDDNQPVIIVNVMHPTDTPVEVVGYSMSLTDRIRLAVDTIDFERIFTDVKRAFESLSN